MSVPVGSDSIHPTRLAKEDPLLFSIEEEGLGVLLRGETSALWVV